MKPTHRLIQVTHEIEAWFFSGQPYREAPDWVRAKLTLQDYSEAQVGCYALRDDEGNFWRWMKADEFNRRYERIVP